MILLRPQLAGHGLSLALLVSSFPSRANGDSELYRTSFSYPNTSPGKYYELVVRQSDVDATPDWPDDQPSPPLGPRKAVSIATEFVHKFFPESTDPPLDEIDMRHVGHKSQWIYLVLFKLRSQPGWTRTLDFPVVVLMDGRVVEPRVVPNGESKPFISVSLRKATVVEALTVYRECAGGPLTPAELKISTDVPVGAEISVESQSASNTEMQRIIEKALREQAGVVLTRGAPNQFSVTYDPTVKTSSAK